MNQRAAVIGRLAAWVALIAAVDQGVKGLVTAYLFTLPYKSLPVIQGLFSLTYQTNTGAAFSLLRDLHAAVIVALNVLVLVFFLWLVRPYLEMRAGRLAAMLVLGGAVGNLIDRVFRGYVIDFLSIHVSTFRWPVFNLADMFIVIGVGLLVLLVLRMERAKSAESIEPETDPGGATPT
ncbi:MAG: signal peptidase II [Armatimonadota bacterium]